MAPERGGSAEPQGKIDKIQGFMRSFGLVVFGVLTAVSIVTANPALGATATKGLMADFVVDSNIDNARSTFGRKKKK